MGPPSLIKQPGESRLFSMDFSALLAPGESISAVNSLTADQPTGADALAVSEVAAAGPFAQARIAGGTAGYRYKVTAVVATSLSNVLEGEGYLQVKAL